MLPWRASAQLTDVELKTITVLADRALTVPLSRLASEYSRENQVSITVSYAPSFEQTIAIQEGEAADLFITAHPPSLKQLKQRGLFDTNSLKQLVQANLALVYTGSHAELPDTRDAREILKTPAEFTAISSPIATAEGYYAREALDKPILKYAPVAEMPDTEAMLELLKEQENACFGVMFESDALIYIPQKVVTALPQDWYEPAIFYSAIIPGETRSLAEQFQHYLQSETAQAEFAKYRFIPVTKHQNVSINRK